MYTAGQVLSFGHADAEPAFGFGHCQKPANRQYTLAGGVRQFGHGLAFRAIADAQLLQLGQPFL